MTQANEGRSIDALVARLSATYSHVPAERIADVVRGAYARFDDRPLREYVPLFVERRARRELGGLDA